MKVTFPLFVYLHHGDGNDVLKISQMYLSLV